MKRFTAALHWSA